MAAEAATHQQEKVRRGELEEEDGGDLLPLAGSKAGEPTASIDPLAWERKAGRMICRACGKEGDHWTCECPYKELSPHVESFLELDKSPGANGPAAPPTCTICKRAAYGKEVDVMRRRAELMRRRVDVMRRRIGAVVMRRRNSETSMCVTNLPDDTSKSDLYNLARGFGVIAHLDLAFDESTGSRRQVGIVEFDRRKCAEEAINWLNGYCYGNLILKSEWTTPEPKDVCVPPICPICISDAEASVRVANLPENTCRRDLYNLVCPYGVVTHVYLALDKTGSGRQFGIVQFGQRKNADLAISWLNGYVYGKLNLQAELATPAELVLLPECGHLK